MITCEVCVEGVPGALAAEAGGAHRIELCAGLVEGGTTPSIGTISRTLDSLAVPTVVLIRPRGGDFLYSPPELDALLRDVEAVRKAGAFGIATGVLTVDGEVDVKAMAEIKEAAGDMSVTFHRAFDMTRDPFESMEELIRLELDRILTSGQERSVPEGMELIQRLVEGARGRISIMPGAGIRVENIREVIRVARVREVHFAASSIRPSPMAYLNSRPRMGAGRVPDEYERAVTGSEQVRQLVFAANQEI